jgi:hypothetical protein
LRLHFHSKDKVAPKPRDEPSKLEMAFPENTRTLISEGLSCAEIAATVCWVLEKRLVR